MEPNTNFSSTNPPAVAFVTMGCAKNEVDTQRMQSQLRRAGFAIANDPQTANAVVVNTCSFIQSATEESLEAIFEVAGMPNVAAGAALIVAGCMPARYGEELADELQEASAFVPCSKEDDISSIVAGALGLTDSVLEDLRSATLGAVPEGAIALDGTRAVSAYVKISDGCDRFCSYCTIPYIRGRYHSFPYEQVRQDVADRVAEGVREVVLIAQDTGRWGQDFDEPSGLGTLAGKLADEFPDTWFRIMYIQPEGITDELLATVAGHDNICNYFDIPLQHVQPRILKAMHRKGSREEYEQLMEHVRDMVPGVTLRTTLIAGFPGETEDDFDELCDFVEEGLFDYIGVFAYSREEGTRAYDLPDQVEDDEKAFRAQRLRDLADDVCTPLIASRVGSTVDVLVEGTEEDGQLFGRAMCQAPEVDGVTYVDHGKPGEIVRVKIADTLLYEMEGE